jgi:hypothetical protein
VGVAELWVRGREAVRVSDGLALTGGDTGRRSEVEPRNELHTVPLQYPGTAFLVRRVPAQELLERLSMCAGERGVGQIEKQRHEIVERRVGRELPTVLDDDAPTLREWDDRFDTTRQRARHDPRDLTISERPDQLTSDDAPSLIQTPKVIDVR